MNNRRQFLQQSLAGGLLCSTPVMPVLASSGRIPQMKSGLSYDAWKQLQGSRFRILDANGNLQPLTLVDLESIHLDAETEQFDLLLQADNPRLKLPESSYVLQHTEIGSRIFFLQPRNLSGECPGYRVCISQLVSTI